jgi:hypothetical protein
VQQALKALRGLKARLDQMDLKAKRVTGASLALRALRETQDLLAQAEPQASTG